MWLIHVNPNGSNPYFKDVDVVFIPERVEEKARDLFARRYEIETEEERRAFKARGELCRAEGYVFQDVRAFGIGILKELEGGRSLIWEYKRKGGIWWEHLWRAGVEVREVEKFFGRNPRLWDRWREAALQDDYG